MIRAICRIRSYPLPRESVCRHTLAVCSATGMEIWEGIYPISIFTSHLLTSYLGMQCGRLINQWE